jgi:hypothetical protein
MVYGWHSDPSWNPFSAYHNLTNVINGGAVNFTVTSDE